MIELFSVRGGNFHKPHTQPTREQGWQPRLTACGRIVTPLNFFETAEDADRHTGGRLSRHLCKQCEALMENPEENLAPPGWRFVEA